MLSCSKDHSARIEDLCDFNKVSFFFILSVNHLSGLTLFPCDRPAFTFSEVIPCPTCKSPPHVFRKTHKHATPNRLFLFFFVLILFFLPESGFHRRPDKVNKYLLLYLFEPFDSIKKKGRVRGGIEYVSNRNAFYFLSISYSLSFCF